MNNLVCSECETPYNRGALFCGECGRNLIADYNGPSRITESGDRLRTVGDRRGERPPSAGKIEFVILNNGRRITLHIEDELHLGRADPVRDIEPHLDFSGDDGAALGVSRLHASLQSTENGVMLVDLGSTNGTFLRDELVAARKPVPVLNGDILRLGDILVQVFFEM